MPHDCLMFHFRFFCCFCGISRLLFLFVIFSCCVFLIMDGVASVMFLAAMAV